MPPDLIPTSPIQWGVFGILLMIVVTVVYALIRGHIVPRSVVDAQLTQAKDTVDFWKDVAKTQQEINKEMMPILQEIRQDNKLVVRAFELRKKQVGGEIE